MNKEILREKYLKIRKDINKLDKEKYDNDIFTKVINLKEYKESKLVLIYVSLENEVDTFKIIEHSLKIGKKVAVPKCIENNIIFYYISSLDELEKGKFNILEPKTNKKVIDFNNSICIIPAVAFDKENNRIGYGKGFYDRFLKNYYEVKIGLTYRECICEKIDNDINDVKVDKIITNGGSYESNVYF